MIVEIFRRIFCDTLSRFLQEIQASEKNRSKANKTSSTGYERKAAVVSNTALSISMELKFTKPKELQSFAGHLENFKYTFGKEAKSNIIILDKFPPGSPRLKLKKKLIGFTGVFTFIVSDRYPQTSCRMEKTSELSAITC